MKKCRDRKTVKSRKLARKVWPSLTGAAKEKLMEGNNQVESFGETTELNFISDVLKCF